MAHPYRTAPPRAPKQRSQEERLLTGSVAFCCACVIVGWSIAKLDSIGGVLVTAGAGAVMIARGPRTRR